MAGKKLVDREKKKNILIVISIIGLKNLIERLPTINWISPIDAFE